VVEHDRERAEETRRELERLGLFPAGRHPAIESARAGAKALRETGRRK
jgi:hypothetical protein